MSNPRIRQVLEDLSLFQRQYNQVGNQGWDNKIDETAQLIEDYFLELVNECDPTPNSQNKSYWGNKLRNKIKEGK